MRGRRGFTLVELLAVIAIAAILSVLAVEFIGSYIAWAKNTSDQQTLTVLNDALNRYKCEGGDLTALTQGAPLGDVLARLRSAVTWNGYSHSVMNAAITVPSISLDASGNGKTYQFTRVNTAKSGAYDSSTYVNNHSPPPLPSGKGSISHASGTFSIPYIATSTGFFAYQVDGGTIRTSAQGWSITTTDAGTKMTFWACPSLGDSSVNGDVTVLSFYQSDSYQSDVTSVNFKSLLALTSVDFRECTAIKELDLSGHTALTYLRIEPLSPSPCTSINLSGCSNWTSGKIGFWNGGLNNIQSIDISGCSQITSVDTESAYGGSQWTSLNVSGCSALSTLDVRNGKFSSSTLNQIWFLAVSSGIRCA